ncbi:MAG: sigma-54-dependent Fis family transcriptional regulator [Rhodanobacteraceae bacterium]|nr:MAG: sigma-54-dependent Fis family transcriptional regulator [Rhodanobacteraceae bacterium]
MQGMGGMATGAGHVLLVSGNTSLTTMATAAAESARCQLTCLAELGSVRELIAKKQFDLILVDACAFGRKELERFLTTDMTRQGRVVLVDGVRRRDAGHVATTPGDSVEHFPGQISFDALQSLMGHALQRTPSREIPPGDEFSGMIGRTMRMQALFENIRRVAPLDVGVLVQGESGTGKELVAQALHRLSGRAGKFIAVNCGAVSPELLGSQIFGHERGSFTGATQAHAGYFEQARGGTLFLDEITEMPTPLQVYLLRVIETHALTRVGGAQEIPVDVRVIAASNRDLQRAVAAGVLREDLYFRLLEFPLALPPLRERREDIPLLARHFLNGLNTRYGTRKRIGDEALRQLGLRAWPGNVRELRHAVQRQYILAGDSGDIAALMEAESPLRRRSSDVREPARRTDTTLEIPAPPPMQDNALHFNIGTTTFEAIEREVLLKTLAHFHNNKREAARALGVSLKTIYNKLLRYRAQGLIGEDVLDDPPEHNGRAA